MASIVIDVIDVSPVTKVATAKGGYEFVEVAYKKDGKVEGKKIVDFANKEVFKAVKDMQAGKTYEVAIEKDKDDKFWQWIGVTGVSIQPVASSPTSPSAASGSMGSRQPAGGRVTGSNYETPEERAAKQRFIIRQTCLERALSLLIHNSPKGMVDKGAVTEIADYFVQWIHYSPTQPPEDIRIEDANQEIMAMKNDIPF